MCSKMIGVVFLLSFLSFALPYREEKNTKQWILDQRQQDGGWGKDTPRAVVALYFADKGFFSPTNTEGQEIVKQLEVELAVDLMRSNNSMDTTDLALYINALVATCRNPRNFYGLNLVLELIRKTDVQRSGYLSAIIALCNAKEDLPYEKVVYLDSRVTSSRQDNAQWTDNYALALMGFLCYRGQYDPLNERMITYSRNLAKSQKSDGAFGNLYTSAMVMQALFATGIRDSWDRSSAEGFISRHQMDGGYGDLLATYLILPALEKSHLTSLRNATCTTARTEKAMPKSRDSESNIRITYSLLFDEGKSVIYKMEMSIPRLTSFYEVMKIAASKDQRFQFQATNTTGLYFYSISGKTNDPERRMYWFLNVQDERTRNIPNSQISIPHNRVTEELPNHNSHYSFCYKEAPL